MDYEQMWHELKKLINMDLSYYQHSRYCSMMEASQGQTFCFAFLSQMDNIENKYMEKQTVKALKIKYVNENGDIINSEYDTIIDFLDQMDSDDADIPMMDYVNVEADFFENPQLHCKFATIECLYNHCKSITR